MPLMLCHLKMYLNFKTFTAMFLVSKNHNENTPTQYTAIFHGCKNDDFQLNYFYFFSYFCSKHILWVHVRTASLSKNKKIMYTPVNPSFTI